MKISVKNLLISAAALLTLHPLASAADAPANPSPTVATVGSAVLTEDQMRKELGMSLYNAENNLFQLKRNWIDKKAKDVLFDQAAKEGRRPRKEWEAKEIDSQVPSATDAEIQQMIQRMGPFAASTDTAKQAQMKRQATQYLSAQKRAQRENELYQQLLQKTPVVISLAKPEAPHIDVTYTKDNPVKGSKDAPVTLVEFTDFQCPWCKRSQDSVRAVEQAYGKQVKIVARAFPLTSIHPRALPAAEAASCAKEQGKYWEYRDKLFEKQALSDDDFKRYAQEVGLKEKKFEKCLADHKYQSLIQTDIADGQRFGVQGTPTFFVNGMQTGFQQLQDAVKDELAKKK